MDGSFDRRTFLRRGIAVSAAMGLLGREWSAAPDANAATVPGPGPFGALQPADANGLQLPSGFTSRVIATSGQPVGTTGYTWHMAPDGAACFRRADGGWVLVSNSEVLGTGGVSALQLDATGQPVAGYRILSNTDMNCAGGPTPWGTWLSGEEVGDGHIWECVPHAAGQGIERPLLGTFKHEAAAVDPATGIVYMTEDALNGRLYRFVPTKMGDMSAGQLQAASVSGTAVNWINVGWENPERGLSTTIFFRGEGMWVGDGVVYFSTTFDHRIWQYTFATARLVEFYSAGTNLTLPLRWPDNLTVHEPSGDLYVGEDGDNMELCVIARVGSERQCAPFIRWSAGHAASEVSGVTFNPDGTRLYVSSQRGTNGFGVTYEIVGPFRTSVPPVPTGDVLVAVGSTWKYLDDGSNQGTAWRTTNFNDDSWKLGTAPFGYGDPVTTEVGYGPDPNSKFVTTYFRQTFAATHGYSKLTLRLRRDDGAVVYVDGAEVYRSNMPTGVISSTTPASNAVIGADETTFFEIVVTPRLYQGPNVIAVELHQQAPQSSDLSFDLELVGTGDTGPLPAPPLPPVFEIVQAATGYVPAVRIRP